MPFVKANPNEYLVVGRGGKISNRGTAVSTYLWPGTTYVLIPSTQQEATFEMTQESQDGVPLRFKGIIIYRVTLPDIAAKRFNFANRSGHTEIKALLTHMCLGELRAVVSHMNMKECIEQRKTTLTDAVASALREVIRGPSPESGWGIELDVAQVAQVFIVDNELRRQLEAEVRNQIKSTSELSAIKLQEEIKLAQASSERRLQQEGLETERQRVTLAKEKLHLQKELDREEIETETPVRLLRAERQSEILKTELEMRRLEYDVKALEVQTSVLADKAKQDLRKDILPLEQIPTIAAAVSRMFQGANLSVYSESAPLLSAIGPLVELLANTLREASGSQATAKTQGDS